MTTSNQRFIQACKGLPVDTTPVWFMRQAGRYQPEYRALRKKYTLLEISRIPELCAEVTMLPVTQLGVDAAIIFSDISVIFEPIGAPFEIRDNVGPVVFNPITTAEALDSLRPLNPKEDLPHLLKSIQLVVNELDVPLIGFSGAPFTLSSYLIEGGPTRTFLNTRKMMWNDPGLWHALMEHLTDAVTVHLRAQAEAGAHALQVFDSWVGCLSAKAYREFVAPHMKRLFISLSDLDVPIIHFAVNAHQLLRDMREVGGDVIGVDWRMDISEAWKEIGFDRSIQGNLDPTSLLGPWEGVRHEAQNILAQVEATGQSGHIFNLGHGVLPPTPVDQLKRLVDFVHGNEPKKITSTPRNLPSRFPNPMPKKKDGVLLMAYGSPPSPADIAPYYTHIRGNRPPKPESVADLTSRYQMIGGLSPLTPTTLSLAHKLENRLDIPVYVGMRHSEPFIADTLREMANDNVERAVGITLAPHYSKMSIGAYIKAAEEGQELIEKDGQTVDLNYIESWSTHPYFVEIMARRIREARSLLSKDSENGSRGDESFSLPENSALVFTAHSLPESIRKWNDPYEEDLQKSCQKMADFLGVSKWHFAYQSEGSTADPWLGPDITELIPSLASEGIQSMIVCPIGFVSDHLEIYYDIDIEAQTVARNEGVQLVRTESLNADNDFVELLAKLVNEAR